VEPRIRVKQLKIFFT